MGGRLSPILANLYMEQLEHKVLCTRPIVPKPYFHYVDDVFLIRDEEKGEHQEFLQALNDQQEDINLTEELEENRTLSFLDVHLKRLGKSVESGEDEPLEIAIFRKPTHSGQCLHFKSATPYVP